MAKKRKSKNVEENLEVSEATLEEREETLMAASEELVADEAESEVEAETEEQEELLAVSEADLDESDEEEETSDEPTEGEVFAEAEELGAGFLPDSAEAEGEEVLAAEEETGEENVDLEGTELDSFESASIEDLEFVEDERVESIIESILFASDRPVGLGALKLVFKGTNVKTENIRRTLNRLAVEYAGARRGVTLEEVPGGWQLRTKVDNMDFLRRTLKSRTFRLSGPALEVLSIVAYKQPLIKHEIDEIRGVESGHLLRALMEKGLVAFEGKSDLPGRPMQYGTTRRFLEIFGLRNLKELPTLSQIDELLPEGIDETETKEKQTLSDITSSMSENVTVSYSTGEEELQKIQEQLEHIATSSQFFEDEKRRQREQRDRDRAQNIRDALTVGEEVPNRDVNWLKRYDEALASGQTLAEMEDGAASAAPATETAPTNEGQQAESESGEEESLRFEEDAPHPEDELTMDFSEIDSDESVERDRDGEGEAQL